ncbi:Uncharacterised protein [Mycobacteroides abscessus]|nr:Uncharacterised protein [Mycobacteroides abscessus]
MQHRQQRGAGLGIARDDLRGVGGEARRRLRVVPGAGTPGGRPVRRRSGVDGHRSTPPSTGSRDATATTTSATWPPSHIAATAWRLLNDGSRKCAR